MFASFSAAPLVLTLLAATADAAERPPLPTCEVGVRHIELTADATSEVPVCIRPGLTTHLLFDSKLARVEWEKREKLRWVREGEDALGLIPSEALLDGERVRVTVYFQDDAAPESATFALVVHPAQAERQVEVSRHRRTLASYWHGERQARAEARRCREEKDRLQAECGGREGLTGLIINGLLGKEGVPAQDINKNVTRHPDDTLRAQKIISYRVIGPDRRRGRVAVQMELWNTGATSWTPTGAALVGPKHDSLTGLKVWLLEPIPPGEWRGIVVEVEATESQARGTLTLKLWGGDEAGSVTLDGVTFP